MNSRRFSQAEMAYRNVNMLSKEEVKADKHIQCIECAAKMLRDYTGNFPEESDEMKEVRLEIESVDKDEAFELGEYFRELYPNEYGDSKGWTVVFMTYNRMKDLLTVSDDSNKVIEEEEKSIADSNESSDIIETINNEKMKEDISMSKTEEAMQGKLEQLMKDMGTRLGPDVEDQTMPNSDDSIADAETRHAAMERFEKDKDVRIVASRNSVIQKFILNCPPIKERLVETEGIVTDPEKALTDFCNKFDCKEDSQTGTITWGRVKAGELPNAEKMYAALKEAVADKNKKFKVYESKSAGSLKGVELVTEHGGAAEVKSMEDIKKYLVNKTMGVIPSVKEEVQVSVKSVKNATTKAAGAGTTRANKTAESYLSLNITNRKDAIADAKFVEYWKDIVTGAEPEAMKGCKSELCAKFFDPTKTNADGIAREFTYRMPLTVVQKKTEVADEKMKILGDGISRGKSALPPIDIYDDTAINKMMNNMADIVANAAAKGAKGGIYDDILNNAKAKKEKNANEMAEEFKDMVTE